MIGIGSPLLAALASLLARKASPTVALTNSVLSSRVWHFGLSWQSDLYGK